MAINEEYIFTYEDYLAMIRQDNLICVAENDVEYKIGKMEKEVHQKHDKSFKEVLSNKEEMAFFLREFVGIEVRETELQQYKSEFITNGYEKREADVIYKNAEKEIYYIVEHQSRKDRNMPFRMVEYCIELMKEVVKNSNSKFYPIIVPIVLYTGKGKWNVNTNFAERQKTYEGTYEEYKVNIKYTVVDINKIKDIELLEKQDYLANIMLMEKCENVEERMKMFLQIYDNTKDLNQIKMIISYITNLQRDAFSPDVIESLEKIKKEDDSMMSRALECMKREAKENIEKGRRTGIIEAVSTTIKNMLKYNEDDETIMKYTNAKKEDIDRVRKELNMTI